MTLTYQFLLLSLFPLCFLGMALHVWRSKMRRGVTWRLWIITLLLGSLWASSALRLFGGTTFSPLLVFRWGILGDYALSLVMLGVLLTTLALLGTPRAKGMLLTSIGSLLTLASLALHPGVWGNYLRSFTLAGTQVGQFDLWAGVWVAGWFLPVLSAWLLTWQVRRRLPLSLYLNQTNYWSIMLVLLGLGGSVASIHQPGQPVWQQAGLLVITPAALVGTLSLSRSQLPDLALLWRRLLRRVLGAAVIFVLTWLALWGFSLMLADLPPGTSRTFLVFAVSGLFAGLFVVVHRLVNLATQRFFLPPQPPPGLTESEYLYLLGSVGEPARLTERFLLLLKEKVGAAESWLFVAEEGAANSLVLRFFAALGFGANPPAQLTYAADSPFARIWRSQPQPLMQHDIDLMREFRDLDQDERAELESWQRVLYQPIFVGEDLVGLLMLGAKQGDLTYNQADVTQLQQAIERFGPLLVQAQAMTQGQQLTEKLLQEKQELALANQQLRALNQLYGRFLEQLTPELKRPFHGIRTEMAQHPQPALTAYHQELEETLERLIQTAARLRKREKFQFEPVRLEEIARTAQRRLETMAEARQVQLEFIAHSKTTPILGDANQLAEAVQIMLHNAIKFNRVGGVVTLSCGKSENDVYLRIQDQGVGMSESQLQELWAEFPSLTVSDDSGNGRRSGRFGLTLAQFIAQAHGGRIEVESKYGAGSLFSLYLPLPQ